MIEIVVPPYCPDCKIRTRLVTGIDIYPHRADLHHLDFYVCEICKARCGCHKGTKTPLGTPAGPKLRQARIILHNRRVDPIWKKADVFYEDVCSPSQRKKLIRIARGRVYKFLAERMNLNIDECHIAMFSIDQCREAWSVLRGVTYPEIRAWAKARKDH